MKSVLLFRWGGLGDLIIALPSIQLIRKKFPMARLTLVCRREYGEIFKWFGVIDELLDSDSPQLLPLFLERSEQETQLAGWLRSFDLVVGWFMGEKKKTLEGWLRLAQPGRHHLLYCQIQCPEQISRFFFRKTQKALEEKGNHFSFEECADLKSGFRSREESGKVEVEPTGKEKFVVVHPGSGSEEKCWPLENFITILELLEKKGIGGVLLTGEAEARMRPILEWTDFPPGWSWIHRPSLVDLCQHLLRSDLYLGNDSGVTHLAAACGTQVLALFRKDNEAAWRPFGRCHVLSALSPKEIEVEDVWKEARRLLRLL